MEFIKIDEFQELDEAVQNIFLKWWKPEKLDMFVSHKWTYLLDKYELDEGMELIKPIYVSNMWMDKNECIPLFTEGQLRKFIEEKTNKIVKTVQWTPYDCGSSNKGYSIYLLNKDCIGVGNYYENLGEDLLKAYWKVACNIALSELK